VHAGIGWYLSGEDVRNIQETIANLSAKTVAQHMQSVIGRLHEQVMANRFALPSQAHKRRVVTAKLVE
jgi:hypothetical protein